MFRAQIHHLADGPTLTMEGRLVGDWAEQAKSLITNDSVPKGLIVDLSDLTYVDLVGEEVLSWFKSVGAAFIAKGIYASGLCERLQLPLREKSSAPPKQRNQQNARKRSNGRLEFGAAYAKE
jgi:hypothetical protein